MASTASATQPLEARYNVRERIRAQMMARGNQQRGPINGQSSQEKFSRTREELGLLQKLLRLAPEIAKKLMSEPNSAVDTKHGDISKVPALLRHLKKNEPLFSEKDASTLGLKAKSGEARSYQSDQSILVVADRKASSNAPRNGAVVQVPVINGNMDEAKERAKAAMFLLLHEAMMEDLRRALDNKDFKQAGILASQMELNFEQSGINPNGPGMQDMAEFRGLMDTARDELTDERERCAPGMSF